jgi:hypothetical protein
MSSSSKNLNETLFNGKVTHVPADFCPVLGKSLKYENLIYNFGISN